KLQTSTPDNAVKKTTLTSTKRSNREIKLSATRDAIALILQVPSLALEVQVPDSFKYSEIQGLPLLHEIYTLIINHQDITPSALIERWRENDAFAALQKMMQRDVLGTDDKQNMAILFADFINNLSSKHNDHRYEILEQKLHDGTLTDDERSEYQAHFTR
ncbi:MAG: hypothetical protein OEY06_10605, partial [Gammaproteobacteria bacterium]|nr:hypothetical protein [Gammaproteobacteria bacterium]